VKIQRLLKNKFVAHFTVSLVAISIFLANSSSSGLWHPDAPTHALNGVFYKDMIEDGGFFTPMSYAERYYAQYPSLTVGIHPPVFYTIEALFFKVFGISPLIAKSAILFFSLIGVNMFLILCRLWFPAGLSVFGSILYLFQPGLLFGQKNVMLEIPALAMSVITIYCLYIGSQRKNSWALFLGPIISALALLTKQNTVFLLPIWFVWIVLDRKLEIIRSGRFVCGVIIGAIILAPWAIVSFTVGKHYLVGTGFGRFVMWPSCVYYLKHSSEIVSYPVFVLFVVAVILLIRLWEKDGYKFALVWVCSVLLFLSFIRPEAPRYAIYLVPALVIMSTFVISFFTERFRFVWGRRSLSAILIVLLICLHINPQKIWGGRDIQGFDQPVDFVMGDPDCVSVLYDGYFNTNFIFHMRVRDEDRRVFVFRASKLIFSTMMMVERGYYESVKSIAEFYQVLDGYSIKYIIQEETDSLNTAANRRLRQWMQEPKFRLVQRYSVPSRGIDFGDLLVYEYLDYEARPFDEVELDMPMMGRRISVKLERGNSSN
jgi:hypothetical protein